MVTKDQAKRMIANVARFRRVHLTQESQMKRTITTLLFFVIVTGIIYSVHLNTQALGVVGNAAGIDLPGNDVNLTGMIDVFVVSADYTRKTASVDVWVRVECSYPNITEIGIILEGDVYDILRCSSYGGNIFSCNTNFQNWPLRGDGETYPFDSYVLRGFISRQFYFLSNQTTMILYPNVTLEKFDPRSDMEVKPSDSEFIDIQFTVPIKRSSQLQAIQLMVPIMFSYFVLGASALVRRNKLNERLTVYLALFFFVPTFMLATQNFLPNRASLSIPEILMIGIMTTTAFFTISAMIPVVEKTGRKVDIFVTIVAMITVFLLYYPIFVLQTNLPVIFILLTAEIGVASGLIIERIMSSKALRQGFSRFLVKMKNRTKATSVATDDNELETSSKSRREAKMKYFDEFSSSILGNKERFLHLSSLRLEILPTGAFGEAKMLCGEIYDNMHLMMSEGRLVSNSKVMHFLLPDLVMPMDRQNTLNFFFGYTNESKSNFMKILTCS